MILYQRWKEVSLSRTSRLVQQEEVTASCLFPNPVVCVYDYRNLDVSAHPFWHNVQNLNILHFFPVLSNCAISQEIITIRTMQGLHTQQQNQKKKFEDLFHLALSIFMARPEVKWATSYILFPKAPGNPNSTSMSTKLQLILMIMSSLCTWGWMLMKHYPLW